VFCDPLFVIILYGKVGLQSIRTNYAFAHWEKSILYDSTLLHMVGKETLLFNTIQKQLLKSDFTHQLTIIYNVLFDNI